MHGVSEVRRVALAADTAAGSPTKTCYRAAGMGFHPYFAKKPTDDGYSMDHTSLVTLTNAKGEFKDALDFDEPVEVRFQKLQRLVREG